MIDEKVLIAEINKRIKALKNKKKELHFKAWDWGIDAEINDYKSLLSFIDTLKVKEVDLEKESLTWEDILTIHRCIKDAMNYNLSTFQTIEGQQKVYEDVLKRFKAQKGE